MKSQLPSNRTKNLKERNFISSQDGPMPALSRRMDCGAIIIDPPAEALCAACARAFLPLRRMHQQEPVSQQPIATSAAAFALPPIPSLAAQRLVSHTHDVWIYIAGSTVLKAFLQPLGITAFKIGSTACRDVDDRISDLRRKQYAGKLGVPGDFNSPATTLEKAHEWFLTPIQPEYMTNALLPPGIAIEKNTLRVTVPRSVSHARFDEALRSLLAERALDRYLESVEGRKRLIAAGCNPDQSLVTDYDLIGLSRRSKASEIYLIRVRRELPELIKAISALIAGL
jgi:hypothetical protein